MRAKLQRLLSYIFFSLIIGSLLWFSVTWLVVFTTLDIFPKLQQTIDMRFLQYYRAQLKIPDKDLIYRYRPNFTSSGLMTKGVAGHPVLGPGFKPLQWKIETNSRGFLRSSPGPYEVVVLGDSFLALGGGQGTLFTDYLEQNIGSPVLNLGVPSYGPYQYLKAFQKYGLIEKPSVAVFVLYPENDLGSLVDYERWQQGDQSVAPYYNATTDFGGRLLLATTDLLRFFNKLIQNHIRYPIAKLRGRVTEDKEMKAAVRVNMGGTVFWDLLHSFGEVQSKEETAALQPAIKKLTTLVTDFARLARENNITPILLYLPSKVTVYAPYVTEDSGSGWKVRSNVAANRWNLKEVMLSDLQGIEGLEILDLTTALSKSCEQGTPPYLQYDLHWNQDGMKVAAAAVSALIHNKNSEIISGS